jgi:tetratricopeptide (TPR) repeat protein
MGVVSLEQDKSSNMAWTLPALSPKIRLIGVLLPILLSVAMKGIAQPNYFSDSLKKRLAHTENVPEKINVLLSLATYYAAQNDSLAEQYARQALDMAELSRDRSLMINTYVRNGNRYLNLYVLAGKLKHAQNNYEEAERISKSSGNDTGLVYSYCGLAQVSQIEGNNEKALSYCNMSVPIAANLGEDSARMTAMITLGDTYMAMNEKLLAFRNYLEALTVAELSKRESLLRYAYINMSSFYSGIEEYDKAIDYEMKVLAINRDQREMYQVMSDYNRIGGLFSKKKQWDLALQMYENSIALTDTLHFDLYKLNAYLAIWEMYFNGGQYVKGMAYLNSRREVMDFLNASGLRFIVDAAYGSGYAELGKFDSALLYLKKAEPDMEKKASPFLKYNFYGHFGNYYKKKGDYQPAISYYLKAQQVGKATGSLDELQNSAGNLDTLYSLTGDFKTAYLYNKSYYTYKDSIRSLARETDLLKLEVDNDNRRRERLAREEQENTERRHNVQYMGLTIGLISLFVILGMLGFFVVHTGTIRALGFFSFIFLFEFIILLADKQIHEWTHGEPWKVLLIKIFLAAILLPLHHWLEHRVIHYLTSRKKIARAVLPALGKMGTKKTAAEPKAG